MAQNLRMNQTPTFPNAADSDPIYLGWMQGSPPPTNKLIRHVDGDYSSFPKSRWAFSHFRQLMPTTQISRGMGVSSHLSSATRTDIDSVIFQALGTNQRMTWGEAFDANYTDGIVVLHNGKIIYEKYAGALTEQGQHIAYSVTKSFFGLIGEMLLDEGLLDETALIPHYIPELASSAFGNATVRQVMDMITGLDYSEVYTDPEAHIWNHARAGGILPKPNGYTGPQSFYEFLQTVKPMGEHGTGFTYKTINTDVLGWLIRRVTNQSLGQILSERIWSKLGCEQDAYMMVDTTGTEFAGGGLNTALRDLARFGEMMRGNGSYNGQQIVNPKVIANITKGANKAHFASSGYVTLPSWSYRSMWWISHNEHGAYMARGIHGQAIYIDPKAQMTIARYASHHFAGNMLIDPASLPAYHALAQHLMNHP
jgi:CubicO group peptidase (beta-lactamase class C family)